MILTHAIIQMVLKINLHVIMESKQVSTNSTEAIFPVILIMLSPRLVLGIFNTFHQTLQ